MIQINKALINILLNHKSIRKFKDKKIDKEILDIIIECGQKAPTSNNLQAYTIIHVQDNMKKEKLAQISGDQKWVVEAPVVLLFCADLYRIKNYSNIESLSLFGSPELYTVAVIDTALAAEKSLIAAQSLGLGGVIVGGIRNDMEKVHNMFNLPNLVAPLFLLCLGYPDDDPGLKPRLPKEVIYKVDNYDTEKDTQLIEEYNKIMEDYYRERSSIKAKSNWSQKCRQALTKQPSQDVGHFLRSIGFLT